VASEGELQGIIGVNDEAVVSSDFIGDLRSCVVDIPASIMLNNRFFKIVAWYDNEMAYSQRLLELVCYVASKEEK